MSRPSPAELLAELRSIHAAVDALAADSKALESELDEIRESLGMPDQLGVAHIARLLGKSTAWLTNPDKPYRLPNFGVGEWGEAKKTWSRATIREWYRIPEVIHRQAWERMRPDERRAIITRQESAA